MLFAYADQLTFGSQAMVRHHKAISANTWSNPHPHLAMHQAKLRRLRGDCTFSDQDIAKLHITHVHALGGVLCCILSDGKTLCLPEGAALLGQRASRRQMYSWHIRGDGQGIIRRDGANDLQFSLRAMIVSGEATIFAEPDVLDG